MPRLVAEWREDIDALQFAAVDHGGVCVIHRLAFRSLLGFTPQREDCLAYFTMHSVAFDAAASAKIAAANIPPGRSFHLNSRDVSRQLNAAKTL
ncbi:MULTISPECIES: hypothetical protein [unclassified Sinorhizobium]|uniref:hypothetical protein n=1 Tax=unclassified Sinorhizobium TaxID=2613772 RepID=UPI0035266A1D